MHKPKHFWFKKIDNHWYLKNLHSPLNMFFELDQREFKLFQKIVATFSFIVFIKHLLFIAKLIGSDLLIIKEKNESNFTYNYQKSKVFSFWIHLTNQCNLRCKYCYVRKSNQVMNKEIVQQLTSSFPILKKQGYKALHFKFAGGEPFLNFKLLKDSFFLFKKNCQKLKLSFHCSIISNGTVYNQDIVDFLKNQNEISLTISVDGFGKCHDKNRVFVNGRGSFRTVITNIKKFCESGFKPNLSVSIDNSNCDGLKQLFVFCKRHNIQFTINFIRDSQQNDPLIFIKKMVKNYQYLKKIIPLKQSLLSTLGDRAYLDNYHLYPCDVENDYAIIDHFGEIYKCQMLINQKEHVWGNVFNKNWPILFKQKRQINISVEDRKQCSNCDWKYFCAGGCPLFNHFSKFSIGNQSNCIIYKNILPIIIELEIRQRICHN